MVSAVRRWKTGRYPLQGTHPAGGFHQWRLPVRQSAQKVCIARSVARRFGQGKFQPLGMRGEMACVHVVVRVRRRIDRIPVRTMAAIRVAIKATVRVIVRAAPVRVTMAVRVIVRAAPVRVTVAVRGGMDRQTRRLLLTQQKKVIPTLPAIPKLSGQQTAQPGGRKKYIAALAERLWKCRQYLLWIILPVSGLH